MNNKNVLVTGGAGYIGSMTAKILKNYGYTPIVVDNLQTGFEELVKFGPFVYGDIGDTEVIKKILLTYQPIATMHFAASTSVGESVFKPMEYYYNNTIKSFKLFKTMKENGFDNLIFSSTAALFGNPPGELVNEDDPILPINPYGRSKAAVENILNDFDHSYNFKYISLRYFNVVGADPELEVGECRVPGLNLFPIIFYNVTHNQDVLIYGDDYNTYDGTCIRDYIHVYDLALAHVLAMENLIKNKKSAKINLGNGVGYSVKEIIEAAKKVMNNNFNVKIVNRREGDPAKLISSVKYSNQFLKWEPKYTSVETPLTHAWEWFKKHHNL